MESKITYLPVLGDRLFFYGLYIGSKLAFDSISRIWTVSCVISTVFDRFGQYPSQHGQYIQ